MKKKIVFLAFSLLVISFSANAQFKIGATLGVPFKLNSLNVNDVEIESSRPFNLGIVTEMIFPPFGIGFEVSALYELEMISGDNIVKAVNVGYIIIPANFKWKFGFSQFKVFAKAGPSFSIKVHDSGNIDITQSGVSFQNFKPKPFNFGLNVGAGFEIMSKVQVGAAYFYNFTDPFVEAVGFETNNDNSIPNNGGFVVSLSYFF
ncbi:MAG: outer membrane beta-barrel protein [Bacteroidales bacterium]